MATHSSILAWRIPWTEEPGGYIPRVSQSQTQLKRLSLHTLATDICRYSTSIQCFQFYFDSKMECPQKLTEVFETHLGIFFFLLTYQSFVMRICLKESEDHQAQKKNHHCCCLVLQENTHLSLEEIYIRSQNMLIQVYLLLETGTG